MFDLDGTLIDSREDLADAVNAVRILNALPPLPTDTVTGFLGDGLFNLMSRAIPQLKTDADIKTACTEMSKYYQQRLLVKTKLYPGVRETLEILAQHHKLAVVSNKPDDSSHMILNELGILHFFSAVIGGGRCKSLKPNPEPLFMAAEECKTNMKDAWMVGDHRTDMGAAKAANIKACFCAYGFGKQDTQRADAIIQHFNMLTDVIQQ